MKRQPSNPVFSEEVAKALMMKCMRPECQKPVEGYYARYGNVGVCSKACMKKQDLEPRYPGFSEADYFARQGETMDENPDILESGE